MKISFILFLLRKINKGYLQEWPIIERAFIINFCFCQQTNKKCSALCLSFIQYSLGSVLDIPFPYFTRTSVVTWKHECLQLHAVDLVGVTSRTAVRLECFYSINTEAEVKYVIQQLHIILLQVVSFCSDVKTLEMKLLFVNLLQFISNLMLLCCWTFGMSPMMEVKYLHKWRIVHLQLDEIGALQLN